MVAVQAVKKLKRELRQLVTQAEKVRRRAYAPYSRFKVGAVVVDEKGKVHAGCNVENASYGGTICAERNAICQMVSGGGKKLVTVVLVSSATEPVFPCGLCIQVIREFGANVAILTVSNDLERYRMATLPELYPYAFSPSDLP